MWKRLRHPNIVGFIGVTQNPLQLVLEWMPNGTLTEYLGENPGANRLGLVSFLCDDYSLRRCQIFPAVGYCRRSHISSCNSRDTRGLEWGRCLLLVALNSKLTLTSPTSSLTTAVTPVSQVFTSPQFFQLKYGDILLGGLRRRSL